MAASSHLNADSKEDDDMGSITGLDTVMLELQKQGDLEKLKESTGKGSREKGIIMMQTENF